MKKHFLFLLFTLISLPIFALRIESGKAVVISEDIHEDVYIAAGNVTINGKVFGDVVAVGGKIFLRDTVTGDVMMGGGELTIDGWVGDDVRVAGGTVDINAGVHGDLIVTGGEVRIASNATINGELLAASGDLNIDGTIRGNANIGAGDIHLNGLIQGDLDLKSGDFNMDGTIGGSSSLSVTNLNIGPKARFEGNVEYWAEDGEVDFRAALAEGAAATYDSDLQGEFNKKSNKGEKRKSSRGILGSIWYFLAMALLAGLLHYLFGNRFRQAALLGQSQPFEMGLRGLLFFVATPIIAILFLCTVVGIPIGLLMGSCYLILAALSTIVTASVVAQWLQDNRGMQWSLPILALITAGIAFVMKGLSWIPVLGWVAKFALVCIVFGALYTFIRERRDVAVGV